MQPMNGVRYFGFQHLGLANKIGIVLLYGKFLQVCLIRISLDLINSGKNLYGKTPHAKAYRLPGTDLVYADYRYLDSLDEFQPDLWSRYNSRMAAYAPLPAEQMKLLKPTADADTLVDENGVRLIRFAHEVR